MKYIENTDIQSVRKFTKKFIGNYIIGAILIGVIVSIISEILSSFLPTQLKLIANFLLTIFGFWKISSSAVETSLKEVNINSDNLNKVLKNIFIFLIILLIINILFTYMSFKFSTHILSILANSLTINLIINIVTTIIQYAIIMLFCKNKLEEIVLGKNINKKIYIVLLIVATVILCLISLISRNNLESKNSTDALNFTINNEHESTKTNNSSSENILNDQNKSNSTIANKYENAKWREIKEIICSTSANVYDDTHTALIDLELVYTEKDTTKSYEVIKIVAKVYKKSTNSLIGEKELFLENVNLNYGYNYKYAQLISIELSDKYVGNDFDITVRAYTIEK